MKDMTKQQKRYFFKVCYIVAVCEDKDLFFLFYECKRQSKNRKECLELYQDARRRLSHLPEFAYCSGQECTE